MGWRSVQVAPPPHEILGSATVSSAEDFYDYADEHFDWAETAKTARERAIFLQMAAAWVEVAQRWEGSSRRRAPQLFCEHRSDGRG